MFHSSRWNHEFEIKRSRIAVIGTGASAIQFVPAIQPQVEKLHVFQRTAPWIVKRHDGLLHGGAQTLSPLPNVQRVMRAVSTASARCSALPFVIRGP